MFHQVSNIGLKPAVTRIFDLVLSFIGLFFLSPVILAVCIVNRLSCKEPIFLQERLGRNQVPFTVIKFRTMDANTPLVASHLVSASAITPLGYFLRRTKLDELPQLWNVFKGEMSLVGPRPGLPNQPDLTAAREKLGVFVVRPGITGLSQVSGIDMSTPELLAKTDAEMIASMSIKNYFRYIFLTILGEGQGDRVKPKV